MPEAVTVFILPDGSQFTIKGEADLIDIQGCSITKAPTEVVDGVVVYCYDIEAF